jgi:hypothetical protein
VTLSTYSLRTCSAGEDLGAVRVEDHLDQPLAVAQIDEDDPAVIAAPMHPAAQDDLLKSVSYQPPPFSLKAAAEICLRSVG